MQLDSFPRRADKSRWGNAWREYSWHIILNFGLGVLWSASLQMLTQQQYPGV